MSQLLKLAFQELGVSERVGDEDHNPRIVEYAQSSGFTTIQDDETPWCSIFVNFCCDKLSLSKSGQANARSWMHIGSKVTDPRPGDIVVFWRESIHSWKGHVGFYTGHSSDGKLVFCLGGNQGNQVSIQPYDAEKLLGYRRVEGVKTTELPSPVLKQGSRGEEVVKLQVILNQLDYKCGDPDGIFGRKTTDALSLFQANHRLLVDGIYGNGSKNMLESILQT